VYTSERGFRNLFWAYWDSTSVLTDQGERIKYGKKMLASWKRDGVPANTFLALAKFRREHDKRAENLKPKRQTKSRLPAVKHRKH
jgi:hypothetical protein